MSTGLSRLKPGIKRRTHLLLSASLWSVIGVVLVTKGWFASGECAQYQSIIIGVSVTVGFAKSLLVLDKAASRGIERILKFEDGTCLGAVYSVKTWVLVLFMIGMGVILRNSTLPGMLLCFVYTGVGWSLLFSSRLAWIAWIRTR